MYGIGNEAKIMLAICMHIVCTMIRFSLDRKSAKMKLMSINVVYAYGSQVLSLSSL